MAVRYRGSRLAAGDERALDAYAASGVYGQAQAPVTINEPPLAEQLRSAEETDNLGLTRRRYRRRCRCGAQGWPGSADDRRDCTHTTGVLGGLQDAHSPAARIGLVWFDAHGDFNTPKTTLSGMRWRHAGGGLRGPGLPAGASARISSRRCRRTAS